MTGGNVGKAYNFTRPIHADKNGAGPREAGAVLLLWLDLTSPIPDRILVWEAPRSVPGE